MGNRSFISKELRFELCGLTLWFKRLELWEEFLSKNSSICEPWAEFKDS